MDYIKSQCDWKGAVEKVGNRFEPTLSAPIEVNAEALLEEVHELYREQTAVHWQSQPTLNLFGMSMSYNPAHAREDWKKASFGHPRYQKYAPRDYFKACGADKDTKNNHVKGDFFDSLGFRHLLPEIATKPHLSALFAKFKLPVVRVTARSINGSLVWGTIPGDGGLHKDDSPFEHLRINLNLSSNGDFGLQYYDHEPIWFEPGKNIVVNTDVPHRAFIKKPNTCIRTNLIIGVAPWLNYDKERDEWSLNEYFGRLHPYDIINQELLI